MNRKILICDDDLFVIEWVGFIAREEGYTVITAEDGEQGLQLARQELPDVAVLDIMMPVRDGCEVCRELKSNSATSGIYVILLTAKGEDVAREEARRSGADDCMNKPCSPRLLRQKLHELLSATS
jgi:two-component system alkaline phosphatase synthesis response regulator PhoP